MAVAFPPDGPTNQQAYFNVLVLVPVDLKKGLRIVKR
jgi:hypothetical protein